MCDIAKNYLKGYHIKSILKRNNNEQFANVCVKYANDRLNFYNIVVEKIVKNKKESNMKAPVIGIQQKISKQASLVNKSKNATTNNWILGSDLLDYSNTAVLKRRYCYDKLNKYLNLPQVSYICALYGLRRTGKTVLMKQAISDLISQGKLDKIAAITFERNTEYTDKKLVAEIDDLYKKGIRYIFIDEISYMNIALEDNCLNTLADKYAPLGVKIVIAGTFSYAIKLLENDVLFDRIEKIDTSYFSYKEAEEILGYDIEKFIQYGGIIKGSKDLNYTPEQYMKTAIANNIAYALVNSNEIYSYKIDYDKTDKKQMHMMLVSLVTRMIDQYMHQIVYNKVIKGNYKYADIDKLEANIRKKTLSDSIVSEIYEQINIDADKYYAILLEEWKGVSKDTLDAVTFKHILDILKELLVITDVYFKNDIASIFTSHYLRYGLCEAIVEEIKEGIAEEISNKYPASIATDIIKRDILEAIVHLDIYKTGKYIFDKYRNNDGWEIDLVIEQEDTVDLYEIKHSSNIVIEQAKNMLNKEFISEIEQAYGKKVGHFIVLYRGSNTTINVEPVSVFDKIIRDKERLGKPTSRWQIVKDLAINQKWSGIAVEYRNVQEFLKNL